LILRKITWKALSLKQNFRKFWLNLNFRSTDVYILLVFGSSSLFFTCPWDKQFIFYLSLGQAVNFLLVPGTSNLYFTCLWVKQFIFYLSLGQAVFLVYSNKISAVLNRINSKIKKISDKYKINCLSQGQVQNKLFVSRTSKQNWCDNLLSLYTSIINTSSSNNWYLNNQQQKQSFLLAHNTLSNTTTSSDLPSSFNLKS
jgi:hypothetical protein